MQLGSLVQQARKNGPAVWCFRWRESGAAGKSLRRSITIGTASDFHDLASARNAVIGLIREINFHNLRVRSMRMTLAQLADHYRQRELTPDNTWKSYATRRIYEIYLRKRILPRWVTMSWIASSQWRWSPGCDSWGWRAARARKSGI